MLKRITSALLSLLIVSTMTACGWVDSTGAQGSAGSGEDGGVGKLRNTVPFGLTEGVAVTATLQGEGESLSGWTWKSKENDARLLCSGIPGFDSALAETRLLDACTSVADCSVSISESSADNGATRFVLNLPRLKSPVALSYAITATRDNGLPVTREQLLCGISINEAPAAENDRYLVMGDEPRIVRATDADSLLSNDSDDIDVRNQPLRVLTTPVRAPQFAAEFRLNDKGGFIYTINEQALAGNTQSIEDSFVYAITDGLHTVNATATLTITQRNQAPEVVGPLPDVSINALEEDAQRPASETDLSAFFSDPDGDRLHFTLAPERLPASGNIVISNDGLLTINARPADVGLWLVQVNASDGIEQVANSFLLTILPVVPEEGNREPVAQNIPNRVVQHAFRYDISNYFSDPDGDRLTFSAHDLPNGTKISASGVISGDSVRRNRGTWFVQVIADDNQGGRATGRFLLIII